MISSLLKQGFITGFILQFAIGPVCVYVFSVSFGEGFFPSLVAIAGVTLADALYIGLALLGVSTFINKQNIKNSFRVTGSVILAIFGTVMVYSAIFRAGKESIILGSEPFLSAFLLTVCNPLTILFWGGLFSVKAAELHLSRRGLLLYAAGALTPTPVFLCFIAGLGSFAGILLSDKAIRALNISVGALLVVFALRNLLKKN